MTVEFRSPNLRRKKRCPRILSKGACNLVSTLPWWFAGVLLLSPVLLAQVPPEPPAPLKLGIARPQQEGTCGTVARVFWAPLRRDVAESVMRAKVAKLLSLESQETPDRVLSIRSVCHPNFFEVSFELINPGTTEILWAKVFELQDAGHAGLVTKQVARVLPSVLSGQTPEGGCAADLPRLVLVPPAQVAFGSRQAFLGKLRDALLEHGCVRLVPEIRVSEAAKKVCPRQVPEADCAWELLDAVEADRVLSISLREKDCALSYRLEASSGKVKKATLGNGCAADALEQSLQQVAAEAGR